MFLIIYDDGVMEATEKLDGDLLTSADDGYTDIVDMSKDPPIQYHKNKWHPIKVF